MPDHRLAEQVAADLAAMGYECRPVGPDEVPDGGAVLLVRRGPAPELLRRGNLEINLSTHQAAIDGAPLDLTYMEYSLLRFLAANPGRVHSRPAILANVWGYRYHGGVRTVDVHVRRLRVKLGDEHGRTIETVRSVGYRFSPRRPREPAP